MEAAASSSNSKFPATVMIRPNDHHLLQKKQHILLAQRTFATFLSRKQEE